MKQSLVSPLSRSSLIRKAVEVAEKQYGCVKEVSKGKNTLSPPTSVTEVSDAVKFVVGLPLQSSPQRRLISLMSNNICTLLTTSQFTAARSHSNNQDRFQSNTNSLGKFEGGDRPGSFDWRQKERLKEWCKSGLSVADLVALVDVVKQGGQKPSKEAYNELLKICFSLINTTTDHSSLKLHPAVVQMVHHMANDCNKEDVKSAIYLCALQVSTSPAQVDNIYKQFVGTGLETKLGKEHLIQAYLQTEDTARPSLSRLLSQGQGDKHTNLTVHTFERLIIACAHKYQLSRCIGVYSCMTQRYGMAPTRKAFSKVTRLLSETFEDDQTQEWKLGLCRQLLADTVSVFGKRPPVWVYVEMAKPLAHILGTNGYNQMMKASAEAAQLYCSEHSGTAVMDLLKSSWSPFVYHSLLECANWTGNTSLALHLLSDMKTLHLSSSWSDFRRRGVRWCATFKLLLELVNSQNHLSNYLPALLQEMTSILSAEQMNLLRSPMSMALERVYIHKDSSHSPCVKPHLRTRQSTLLSHHSPPPGFVSTAAKVLIDTAVQSKSNEHCLEGIASLGERGEVTGGYSNRLIIPNIVSYDNSSESETAVAL